MDVHRLSPAVGALYWRTDTPGDAILFGCFSEVNKWITVNGWQYPHTVVLPERVLHRNVPQLVPEFLFYGFIFREGNFDFAQKRVKRRLRFVGNSRQLQRVWNILSVSYLGTAPSVLDRIRPAADVTGLLRREGDYFALKDGDGNVIPLEDYVELVPWDDDGAVKLDGNVEIALTAPDTYEVRRGGETTPVRLGYDGDQPPVWQLPLGKSDVPRPFGVHALGSYDGFDPRGPSVSLIVWLDGHRLLIDAAPYTDRLLEARGVAPDCIDGIIVTHIHEDHTGGLPALARAPRRLKLWTTPEIWRSIKLKLAAVLDCPASQIEEDFEYHELPVGTPMPFFGAQLEAHYSCHSVPTIGLRFRHHGESLTHTSDVAGRDYLGRMRDDGALTRERYRLLMDRDYEAPGIIIADGGEALIHGYPKDFAGAIRSRAYLIHRSVTPVEEKAAPLLHPGCEIIINAGAMDERDLSALETTLAVWGADERWLKALREKSRVKEFPPGSIVVAEGDANPTFAYVISNGLCNVVVRGVVVARLREREFFGEAAFLHERGVRSADVVAPSSVRLVCIPGEVFRELLGDDGRERSHAGRSNVGARLRKILSIRPFLERSLLFKGLPVTELNRLSLLAEEVNYEAGEISPEIRKDDACFVVVEGTVHLGAEDPGDVFGPNAVFGSGVTWRGGQGGSHRIRALGSARLIVLPGEVVPELAHSSPLVRQRLREKSFVKRESPAA